MLIHRQNSYATRGKRRPGRREAQSRGTGQHDKNSPCISLRTIMVTIHFTGHYITSAGEAQSLKINNQ
jgi:hypothetical protein